MLRIAVQAKGRLFDETMSFLEESDIKRNARYWYSLPIFLWKYCFCAMMIFRKQ